MLENKLITPKLKSKLQATKEIEKMVPDIAEKGTHL